MKKYLNEIKEKTARYSKLLEEFKFDEANEIKKDVDRLYSEFSNSQRERKLYNESSNFGISNHVLNEMLPTLFKKNRKALKEFMTTIRGDKNLVAEALFYKAINDYNGDADSKDYLKECLDLATKRINYSTVSASNKKVADIMMKYGLYTENLISPERKKLYEDCNYLLTTKKSLSNLTQSSSREKNVKKFLSENINHTTSNEEVDPIKEMTEFDDKYKYKLTEQEIAIIKDLTNENTTDTRKRELFKLFKEDTMTKVESMITESDADEAERYKDILETISSMKFRPANVREDIVKLIGVSEIIES